MTLARVVVGETEVEDRLMQFGVSRQELIEVAWGVMAARSDATSDDPASAEGLLAYIYGTRLIRQLFQKIGWTRHNQNNVAAVKHPSGAFQVVYQSVDLAAEKNHVPQAISGKGAGADRVITGQGSLFDLDEISPKVDVAGDLQSGVWFFCVSAHGDQVRAELSLPSGIAQGNFSGFIERIFIMDGSEAETLSGTGDRPSGTDIEPTVVRRL